MTNAIKIVKDGEQVILQCETAAGKKLWLEQLKKAQTSLTTPMQSASPHPRDADRGVPSISHPTQPSSPTRPRSPNGHRRRASNLSAVGKKQPSEPSSHISDLPSDKFSQMMGYLDELNEETDKCHYDKAVETVDKIKYELAQMDPRAPSLHTLTQRLQTQVNKLSNYLYHEIADLIIGKDAMSSHIQRLVVLGFPDEAREKFLAARSDFIKERTKHLRYIGDVAKTVNDIGFATFSSIAASADWYISSFKDHTMTAGN